MTLAMNAVGDLQPELMGLLEDPDHMVRAEAVRALALCPSPGVQNAIRESAAGDRSVAVQQAVEAAFKSLEQAEIILGEIPLEN